MVLLMSNINLKFCLWTLTNVLEFEVIFGINTYFLNILFLKKKKIRRDKISIPYWFEQNYPLLFCIVFCWKIKEIWGKKVLFIHSISFHSFHLMKLTLFIFHPKTLFSTCSNLNIELIGCPGWSRNDFVFIINVPFNQQNPFF